MQIRLEQLGRAAFAVIGEDGATNFGIVRGDDGAAPLIDADIRRIDEIEQALAQTRCSRVKYLFITHENFDHSSANDYYEKQGAVIIASEGCLEALADDGDSKFAEMSGRSPELFERYPGLKMKLPHIVFPDKLTVNLPGATVHLQHYDQSHSRGDATAYFAEDGVFFTGDLLYTEFHPVTIYGQFEGWIKTLAGLSEVSFGKIMPGHGPCGHSLEIGRQHLASFRGYLEAFYDRLNQAKSGRKTVQQIIDETYSEHRISVSVGWLSEMSSIFCHTRKMRLVWLWLLAVSIAPAHIGAAENLVVAFPSLATALSPSWITAERGLWRKYGLEVELIYLDGGSRSVSALIGGSAQLIFGSDVLVTVANLQGANLIGSA